MKCIDAMKIDERSLKDAIGKYGDVEVDNCLGQRYLGCARKDGYLRIVGTPGNGLCAYLDGGEVFVEGNVQDAVADTMNSGFLAVRGNAGDALCYAMRGGKVYVLGDVGYRAGVHMKAYKDIQSTLVIGGTAGSFLGEYLAGGTIVVLGLGSDGQSPLTGFFCANGMYAGHIYLRTSFKPMNLSDKLSYHIMTDEEKQEKLSSLIFDFAITFGLDGEKILSSTFADIEADPHKSYNQLYTTL